MTKDKSILIRNIYYMLSYAFTILNPGGYDKAEPDVFAYLLHLIHPHL